MTRLGRFLVASVAAITAVTGCNPYDPDLGDQPFRCGTVAPICPEGYVCVERTAAVRVCEPAADRDAGLGDSGGVQCDEDAMLEPNETIADPTIVPIPDIGDSFTFTGVVICPETDRDVYQLRVDLTGKNVRVEVGYDSRQGPLAVSLLNSTGISIRTGTPVDGDPDRLRADFANLAAGSYFGQVQGAGSVRAGYAISFLASSSALPP